MLTSDFRRLYNAMHISSYKIDFWNALADFESFCWRKNIHFITFWNSGCAWDVFSKLYCFSELAPNHWNFLRLERSQDTLHSVFWGSDAPKVKAFACSCVWRYMFHKVLVGRRFRGSLWLSESEMPPGLEMSRISHSWCLAFVVWLT